MRNTVVLLLLLGVSLAGPLAAQPAASRPHPDVPAAFDVAGLHLVLTEEAQRLVQQKADGLCRHQPSFQARVNLADAAFPIIDRVLKEEGVPLDFRYLPLQESALLGDARSAHEAVGYWQLKRETATSLGLVVNSEVDERQHLSASTRAAARYLARNNATLHNWLNALLSYNTGLSGVKPYTLPINANATEMAITAATSPYVLMFLAQKIAFESACGQNPTPPLRLQEFPAVPGQSLEAHARTIHIDPAVLAVHNRWLLTPTVPTNRPYTLIVPITNAAQAAGLVANQRLQSRKGPLAEPAESATSSTQVRVNDLRALIALPGETTADLAQRGGKRLGEFLHENELTAFDLAVAGRPYFLESKRDAAAIEYHVVQPGETIFDVAQKYGIRKKAIIVKNHLTPAEELRPGRLLWLQHVRPREVAIEYRSLPEGIALERPVRAPQPRTTSASAGRRTPRRPASRQPAPEVAASAPAQSEPEAAEGKDGWGETLATASATAVPTPAPTRREEVEPAEQLPPPSPAPTPAPLADELIVPQPVAEPVASRAPVVSKSVPVPAPVVMPAPTPMPAPAKPVVAPAPRPVVVASQPVVTEPAPAFPAGIEATHRVEPKETVYSISRRFHIPPATLIALNHLAPPANLAVGQVLVLKPQEPQLAVASVMTPPDARSASKSNPAVYVPKAATPVPTAPAATAAGGAAQHTVVSGETLYSIARRYNVTVDELQVWNAKVNAAVRVGEMLRVQRIAR